MIIETIKQILHVGIGFIFGIGTGVIIASTGFTKVLSSLPVWVTTVLAILFSSGLVGIYVYARNPDKIEERKDG